MVNDIMVRTWKLAGWETYRNEWVKRDTYEEERAKVRELVQEAKAKNDQRTELEQEMFHWKVRDQKMKKWYLMREEVRKWN